MRTFRNTNFKIFFALSLSVIPHFSRTCRLGKQGSLVTQLPVVNVLGNSLIFGILKKNSNFLTLLLQEK